MRTLEILILDFLTNLPVMFEGTNPDKPKPSTQNTRAANLQGDSKLAGFTIEELEGLEKYMEFAGKKRYQIDQCCSS